MDEVDFDSLIGKHTLDTSVVESVVPPNGFSYDEANRFAFGMDGKIFIATEDPDDGYRSYLGSFEVTDDPSFIKGASLIQRDVLVSQAPDEKYYVNDVLVFTDIQTGHIWMKLGTANTHDYYPYCVLEWNPMDPSKLD